MQLEFAMSNDFKFARHLEAGYCFGMSCDWALTSLKSPRSGGVKYAGALTRAKWIIGQTAYETNNGLTDAKLVTGMGLKTASYQKRATVNFRSACNHIRTLVGTYVFCIEGPGGGHAMGYRYMRTSDVLGRAGGSLQWFDPNLGLYSFSSSDDFVAGAAPILEQLYGSGESVNDRLRDHYEMFEVTQP